MAKAKDTDILASYKLAGPEERFEIMFEHYSFFPKVIRKIQKKTEYKIKSDREYYRSHNRADLGVRIQTSDISNPTQDEAIANIQLEEAFKTGQVDRGLLKGFEDAEAYAEDIHFISLMRMDYELMVDCVENLDDDENELITEYLCKRKYLKELAVDMEMSYSNVKLRVKEIKESLMEEVTELLVKNCR